ncbi:DNA-binding protein [Parabacteroides sp. PF5-6]|uniref:HU family DNA-binding protein n=1 Tax=Parabacteroides sp. PF5-6 TaxID=1742403 RepID=UPI002406DBA2|nr:DNA-binding protein [Parabacteroides sp. PF5-6]MDF9830405.1 putative histone-like DNA-binding protein [Parabacteroides sp. PF5-6]
MAIQFRLVERKNLGLDNGTIPKKLYVHSRSSFKVPFEMLLEEIADAGVPSSMVRSVIDRMNFLFRRHLAQGHIIQFGDLGNFRYSLGSTGAETEEEFSKDLIKPPKLVFTPGKTLLKSRALLEFERVEPEVKEVVVEDEGGNEPEGGV